MSASIHWRPVNKTKPSLDVSCPNMFIEKIQKVFHRQLPLKLSENDLQKLQTVYDLTDDDVWMDIYQLIEKHGEIEISAEY